MKLITFAIPCYNSEDYMEKAINSLLVAKEDVEIIIVNDGSKDNTLKIAKDYEKKYPETIKVVDKENGGHGSGVNKGLELATGLYYKVVDSDDSVDKDSLLKTIKLIKDLNKKNNLVDMIIVNYVYDRYDGKKEISYKSTLPENKVFTWNDTKRFKKDEYLLMHSVIYKTSILKECNLKLPEHCFYVDNIFVYKPLPYVKTMYYLNVPFYNYFIGREDQSVNEKTMIKRIDQQIKVVKLMIDSFDPFTYLKDNKNLSKYLIHYMDMMMTVTTILLQVDGTKVSKEKIKDIWNYLNLNNKKLYRYCNMSLSGFTKLPRIISVPGYRIANKIYKFN